MKGAALTAAALTGEPADDGVDPSPSEGAYLERLCELAARDQWKLDDLRWDTLDVSGLPEEFRQIAADAFAQLRWGERTAHLAAGRLLELLPQGPARAFCQTQIADEARHVEFFSRVIALCGCEGRVRPSISRLMREVEEADTPELLLLGIQVLIEGVAHSIFLESAKTLQALLGEATYDGPVAALRAVVGDWMPRLLARDESRHIAFGIHQLRERLPRLSAAERQRLEATLERWGASVRDQAADPDLIYGLGVDSAELCDRLIEDLNLRIAQVGLRTRIAPLKTAP